MKNIGFALVASIVTILIVGCVETPSAKTAGWQTAWHDGKCIRDAGDAAYNACLEHENAAYRDHPPPAMPSASASAQASAPPPPVVPPPQATAQPTASAQPPPPPPQQPAPTAPEQQTLRSGTVIWVPVASGPYCQVQDAVAFELQNNSDYLVEVRGAVVPLNCDSQHFTKAQVLRRNGAVDTTWVVPPHTNSQFTALPLNGGLGNVEINMDVFLNLGPQALAPAIGFIKKSFTFPKSDGGKNWQSIDGYFQKYAK